MRRLEDAVDEFEATNAKKVIPNLEPVEIFTADSKLLTPFAFGQRSLSNVYFSFVDLSIPREYQWEQNKEEVGWCSVAVRGSGSQLRIAINTAGSMKSTTESRDLSVI